MDLSFLHIAIPNNPRSSSIETLRRTTKFETLPFTILNIFPVFFSSNKIRLFPKKVIPVGNAKPVATVSNLRLGSDKEGLFAVSIILADLADSLWFWNWPSTG